MWASQSVTERLRQSEYYTKDKMLIFSKRNWNSRVHNQPEGMKLSLRHVDAIRHWKRHPPRRNRVFRSLFMLFYTSPSRSKTYCKPWKITDQQVHHTDSLTQRTEYDSPARSTGRSAFKGLRMVDVQLSFTRLKWNSEWHYPTYNDEVMAVMSFEHLAPLPRRNHQYHRLYSPSQLERFHVLHPIEQTPDLLANKFLPYDFQIYIEKEHLTRIWSIRFSATRPSSWDMKSWFLENLICDFKWMSFSCLCERE